MDGRTVWVGREEFVEFMSTWTEEFEGWSIQVERLIDADEDGVVALTRESKTGKGAASRSSWIWAWSPSLRMDA